MATQSAKPKLFRNYSDIFVAIAVVGVVLMLIVPLPTFVLDILMVSNLALSMMIILSTMYINKPSDFSAFPTLILITTVFGLALNVSSTRLILTLGKAFDGKVIRAFGNFVVRGNYLVGLIIFIILLAIQFLVITKGASRVSEVAARFTLDSMPGRQLAINEDLNAGTIDEKEARKRRDDLRLETDFYGSMDGSSKFVSGNVTVALVVTVVDIIGGLITGTMRGEGFSEAAKTYVLLTVGDGLISQIPALLISVATGIIVTRTAGTDNSFSKDIISQVGATPQVLFIAGGAIIFIGFLPGFPTLINFLLGGLIVGAGFLMHQSIKKAKEKQTLEQEKSKVPTEEKTTIEDIIRVDPMNLEIGYNLIALVDKKQGGDLLDRIRLIRKRIGLDLGLLVPSIRIIDNVSIDSSEYLVKIRGTEITRGKVFVNRLLAMNPKLDLSKLEGIPVKEPAFGLDAKWIPEEERAKAESFGFDIFDPPSVIATHLTEAIKKNAAELLTRQDVKTMLDALKKEYPAIVDEVLSVSNIGDVQKVLQNLLKEGITIRNMLTILETIADYAGSVKNVDMLTEYVRQPLGKQIVSNLTSDESTIKGIVLDPALEQVFSDSIQDTPQGMVSNVDPDTLHQFVNTAGQLIESTLKTGVQPVILSSQRIRRLVREVLERSFPSIPVVSYSEIPPQYTLEQIGIIRL